MQLNYGTYHTIALGCTPCTPIFPKYLAQSIIIHSSNRSSRKCHTMELVQRSISLAYSESAISVKNKLYVYFKSLLFVLFYYSSSIFVFLLSNDAYNHHVFLKSINYIYK